MADDWNPPFCVHDGDLDEPCPKCAGAVRVREKETYLDGDEVEAYCVDCHAMLTVTAIVDIAFGGVEVAT